MRRQTLTISSVFALGIALLLCVTCHPRQQPPAAGDAGGQQVAAPSGEAPTR